MEGRDDSRLEKDRYYITQWELEAQDRPRWKATVNPLKLTQRCRANDDDDVAECPENVCFS